MRLPFLSNACQVPVNEVTVPSLSQVILKPSNLKSKELKEANCRDLISEINQFSYNSHSIMRTVYFVVRFGIGNFILLKK